MFLLAASIAAVGVYFSIPPQVGFTDASGRPIGDRSHPILWSRSAPIPRQEANGVSKPSRFEPQPYSSGGLQVELEWRKCVMGSGIGYAGLHVADLDQDGQNEIVAAAVPPSSFGLANFWYVLERGADGNYEQQWVSDLTSANITQLELFDYSGDGKPDVCLAVGSAIRVYDGLTKSEIASFSTSASEIRGLNYVDVDSDNQMEWVFVDSSALYIYSKTGALEHRLTGYGGKDVKVGNVLPDRELEIVVANDSSTGYIIHGRFRHVIMSFPQGFGSQIELVDFTGEGDKDIIGAFSWYKVCAYLPAFSRTAVWQINTDSDVAAIWTGDVEGDGIPEVVYGDGQWGSVYVRDARDGSAKWAVVNPEHGVTQIAVGNLDGDAAAELVFGAGYTSSGPDYLYVFDSKTKALEWQSIDIAGPFLALAAGNADLDAAPELLYGSYDSESGYEDGLWFVHDAQTKALEFASGPSTGSNWVGLWRIAVANVDADPQPEIFITTSQTYTGFVICYDSVTHAEQFRTAGVSGEIVHALQIADVDTDGQPEIVVASSRVHTGASGTFVYVFNAGTGALEWMSPASIGTYWAQLDFLRVANVDLDAALEILVAEAGGGLTIFDGVTHFGQVVTFDMDISALEVADLNGSGPKEVIIGDAAGNLKVIDPYSGDVVTTLGSFGSTINGLAIKNVAGNAAPDYVFCQSGQLKIVYRDTSNVQQIWVGPNIAPTAGASDSLLVADVDNDGFQEVFLGDGVYGVRLYEIRP